jgi:hypothetical protein
MTPPGGRLALMLGLLVSVGCQPPHVTLAPAPLPGLAPLHAQVDPVLCTLTERWEGRSGSGDVAVGDLLCPLLVDDPQAPLRVTYVTSHLEVSTVVSRLFYRPHRHHAWYQLSVRVDAPAPGARQAFLAGRGEGHSGGSAARAVSGAIHQAVQDLMRQLVAVSRATGSDLR